MTRFRPVEIIFVFNEKKIKPTFYPVLFFFGRADGQTHQVISKHGSYITAGTNAAEKRILPLHQSCCLRIKTDHHRPAC